MLRAAFLAAVAWLLVLSGLALPAQAQASGPDTDRRASAAGAHRPHSHGQKQRPRVRKVSPRIGSTSGGTKVTVKGSNFKHVKYVLIGDNKVTDLKVRKGRKISLSAPPGLPGKQIVRVVTRSGKSAKSKRSKITYKDRVVPTVAKYSPKAGTAVGTGVVWVTGGTDVANPTVGQVQAWRVGVGPGGLVPAVGTSYYLPPGTPAFSSGLAGTVTDVADEPGGIRALTVAPSVLDSVFSDVQVSYADAPSASRTLAKDVTDGGVVFPDLTSHAFGCKNDDGQTVAFRGSLSLSIEKMHANVEIDTGGLFGSPYVNAWVRYEPVLTGRVTTEAKLSCKLSPAWVNARRKIIPIGATGLTLSFAPAAEFSVTAGGTIEVKHRSRRMVGASYANGKFHTIDESKDLGLTATGNLSFEVEASAGLSVQFGLLDRLGIEGKALLDADGTVEASTANRVCIDLKFGFKVEIGAFLDLWVVRFESPYYSHTFVFKRLQDCLRASTPAPPSSAPQITSLRLPAAVAGSSYSGRLTTADNRPGRWSLVGGALPPGLILNPDTGEVLGAAAGAVSDYTALIRFTDGSGGTDTEWVHLYLGPDLVGSGAFQATLTWGSFADLDLHVVDPDGEEIYYGNPTSESGGFLDRDANPGCEDPTSTPIENVFWPPSGSPPGTYYVRAVVYASCSVTDLNWHLVVRVGGHVVLDRTGSGASDTFAVSVGGSGRPATVRRVADRPLPSGGAK